MTLIKFYGIKGSRLVAHHALNIKIVLNSKEETSIPSLNLINATQGSGNYI